MSAFMLRMSCVCSINTLVQHSLNFFFGTKQIRIICNKDLAAACAASTILIVHICSAFAVCHKSSSHIQCKSHAASLPVSGRKNSLTVLNCSRIAGQISVLIKAARIRKLLSCQTVYTQLSISILAHRHIEHNRAILSWNCHTEWIVSNAWLVASPTEAYSFLC